MTDNDDKLGAFLRSEVPEPRADYWDGIDAMLRRVEQEQERATGSDSGDATASPRPHLHAVTPVAEEISDEMQTDDDLLRLTDMANTANHTHIADYRRHLPLLVAAALAAVVGLGSFFALTRDQAPTEINAAEGNGSTSADPVIDDGEADGGSEEQTTPASETDTASVQAGRQCYSDGTVTLTIDVADDGSFTGWQVPVGLTDNTDGFTGDQLHLAPNGNLLLTLAGLPLDDGDTPTHRVSESSAAALGNGFATISTSTWTVTDAMITQPSPGDEIRYPAVDCTTSAADLNLIESTPSYFPPDLPFEPVTIAELSTTPTANRVCYRQSEGEPVYVFDFTDDGVLANGLRSGALETISATKAFDSETTYNVATLILGDQESGRDTITTNLWEISPERLNLPFDGEEVPAVDCSIVADDVTQVEDFLQAANYPAYPLGS